MLLEARGKAKSLSLSCIIIPKFLIVFCSLNSVYFAPWLLGTSLALSSPASWGVKVLRSEQSRGQNISLQIPAVLAPRHDCRTDYEPILMSIIMVCSPAEERMTLGWSLSFLGDEETGLWWL